MIFFFFLNVTADGIKKTKKKQDETKPPGLSLSAHNENYPILPFTEHARQSEWQEKIFFPSVSRESC